MTLLVLLAYKTITSAVLHVQMELILSILANVFPLAPTEAIKVEITVILVQQVANDACLASVSVATVGGISIKGNVTVTVIK